MALPPLATSAELAAYMQVPEGSLPDGASLALSLASDTVRDAARNDFARRTSTVLLYPDSDGWVSLPSRPVVSVDAVTVDGSAVDVTRRKDRVFVGCLAREVTVTYTYGYAAVPGVAKGVTLALASRLLNNPNDLRQQSVGSVSVTFASETVGSTLAPIERDSLSRFRLAAGTVNLR